MTESWTEADIRHAYENHAGEDGWDVPSFYLDGLLDALRGKYDEPDAPRASNRRRGRPSP